MSSSLNASMLKLWESAASRPITLDPMPKEQATSFRHKLYRYRKTLRDDDHPSYGLASQAAVMLSPELVKDEKSGEIIATGLFILTVYPAALELNAALARAGLTDPESQPPPLE